ncbi:MAG TPA: hypothetical protein VF783_18235 [Terriglobales bacterium]
MIHINHRTPLLVIDTATNTYTRYIGTHRVSKWQGAPLNAGEVEALRADPADFFGEGDPRGGV